MNKPQEIIRGILSDEQAIAIGAQITGMLDVVPAIENCLEMRDRHGVYAGVTTIRQCCAEVSRIIHDSNTDPDFADLLRNSLAIEKASRRSEPQSEP